MMSDDTSLPVTGGAAKREYVRGIFRSIAPRYDLLNHLLSFNADRRWRRLAIDLLGWEAKPDGRYLDLCAGTQDLSGELGERQGFAGMVVAADFVIEMLRRGRGKSSRVRATGADALQLPFRTGSFDGATVGFGLRNLMEIDAGLREAARVIRPGGRFVILELTMPTRQPLRWLYLTYFRQVLPRVGRLVSKHTSAYDWLPASVLAFPEPPQLAESMAGAGFESVTWRTMWGGIVAIHVGVRSGGVLPSEPER